MRKLLFTMVLALMAISASAVPAKRGQVRTLTLEDGSTVQATLVGDEYGHYWLAGDGRAFSEKDDTGIFVLTDVNALKEKAKAKRAQANKLRSQQFERRKASFNGSKKGLIILVNFSNLSMKSAHNNALFQKIANQPDYNDSPFKGSIHDYFSDQSFGVFDLTFDVVGPYKVSNTYSYYGQDYGGQGNDRYPQQMVYEAIQKADEYVDFADYDWDGDGYVDQVYVIYAGKGQADGGATNTIWPHQSNLSYWYNSSQLKFDGKYVGTYACGPELNGNGEIDGIGTMCHEFSHCLGYPDFYDTDYSGGQGMQAWDLMDAGSYNGNGYQPAGYTSYERWVAGWHEPTELLYSQEVKNMQPLQESAESYIIYNKGNLNEYFLLENRQKVGWDASLPGEGLLILHVDYDEDVWAANEPNDDPSHQRMTWIPADNEYQYFTDMGTIYYEEEGMATDPFPYGSVNTFGPNTTPAATLYNTNSNGTKKLDSSVEDITQNSDGTISFNFKGIEKSIEYSGLYQLIKSNEALEPGMKYLIVSALPDDAYVGYNGFSSNKGLPGDVKPDDDNIIDLNNGSNHAVPVKLDQKDGKWTILDTNDGKYLGAVSNNNNLAENAEAGSLYKWTINVSSNGMASIKNSGKNAYLKYNNASNGQCFRVYASGQQPVYLYKEIVETIDVPISALGYGTLYYGEKNLIVPEGIEASTYKVVSGELVTTKTYTTDDVIPAATGVVLKAAEGTYTFTVTTTNGEAADENMLLGFDEAATTTAGEGNDDSNYLFYCLNTKNGENVGFYWGSYGGAPFTSKAHKAYLAVPKTEVNQANSFIFSNDTDGIARTQAKTSDNMVIYDLQGRRYSAGTTLSKGIYIINGKKMVVR